MTAHPGIFAVAVSLLLAGLLGTAGTFLWRARRMQGDPSLEGLLARLIAIDRSTVSSIAAAYDAPASESPGESLESWQIWEMIGGMQGLQALAANCTVLIELACHVQKWYPEALSVAEQLRLNAREVQWHLERLKGAEQRGNLEAVYPDYAQRAIAVYFSMTQHVLGLYETSQVPGWSQLQAAL